MLWKAVFPVNLPTQMAGGHGGGTPKKDKDYDDEFGKVLDDC